MIIDVEAQDVFELSGPIHLCNKRELSAGDKHALMAALVQSVYVAEKDRQQERGGIDALAPSWWMPLGYRLLAFIGEEGEGEGGEKDQIIGAIFKKTIKQSGFCDDDDDDDDEEENLKIQMSEKGRMQLVVAFRGTMLQSAESMPSDMMSNLYLVIHQLHKTSRFAAALHAIRVAIDQVGSENVSIAGHSLGATLAMLGGQTLAREGIHIDTHLFNPPFPSPPIEYIKNHQSKLILNIVRVVTAASLSSFLLDSCSRQEALKSFFALKEWFPHLYVNAQDPICSSYISFFSCHELMQNMGVGFISKLSAPLSLRGALQKYIIGECKAFHLVPCAHLYNVKRTPREFVKAHGLHQWWAPTLEFECREINLAFEEKSRWLSIQHST